MVVRDHQKLADRLEAARAYVASTGACAPMVVDAMDDGFMKTYWAHPERFFVVWDGRLEMKAVPKGEGYRNEDVEDALHALWKRVRQSTPTSS